jgi:hypothetical protein
MDGGRGVDERRAWRGRTDIGLSSSRRRPRAPFADGGLSSSQVGEGARAACGVRRRGARQACRGEGRAVGVGLGGVAAWGSVAACRGGGAAVRRGARRRRGCCCGAALLCGRRHGTGGEVGRAAV